MRIRKTTTITEVVHWEGSDTAFPVTRVAGLGVIDNPFAGRFVQDLAELFTIGYDLGAELMSGVVAHLDAPATSYGKAAIVGVNGDLEHGHALLHPKLGRAMREPIGGGEALIPSAAKVGSAGCTIEVPLGHKDDAWSFDHFDAMSVCVPDAPRPNEIMLVVAIADGGRPVPRVGTTRAVV